MLYEGRYWIDPGGTIHCVPSLCCHEEWGNDVMGTNLESLFSKGWVRIQAFPGSYLLIDHGLPAITRAQSEALRQFFFDQNQGQQAIRYARMVLDLHDQEKRDYQVGQNLAAYTFACTGRGST